MMPKNRTMLHVLVIFAVILVIAMAQGCALLERATGLPLPGACDLSDDALCALELQFEQTFNAGVQYADDGLCVDVRAVCPNGREPDCGTICGMATLRGGDESGDARVETLTLPASLLQ